jgi:hypothetical protein
VGKFIRYLLKQQKIFAPNGDIRGHYDPLTLDRDVELIILSGRAKDPIGAARLMAQYNVSTASELLPLLPRRRRPSVRTRMRQWMQRLLGVTEHDPAHRREQATATSRHNRGMTITHLGR